MENIEKPKRSRQEPFERAHFMQKRESSYGHFLEVIWTQIIHFNIY